MSNRRIAESEFRPLGLNTRTIYALVKHGVYTLRDLTALTEREVSRMAGIGEKARSILAIYLRKEGPSVEIHNRRKSVSTIFEPAELTSIDAWALDNAAISRAEAIRRLVELGLKAKERK